MFAAPSAQLLTQMFDGRRDELAVAAVQPVECGRQTRLIEFEFGRERCIADQICDRHPQCAGHALQHFQGWQVTCALEARQSLGRNP